MPYKSKQVKRAQKILSERKSVSSTAAKLIIYQDPGNKWRFKLVFRGKTLVRSVPAYSSRSHARRAAESAANHCANAVVASG